MSENAASVLWRPICWLFGHRRRWWHYVSPPQPASANCAGDHWCIGYICPRCGKHLAFAAGVNFIHKDGYGPLVLAASQLLGRRWRSIP